MNRQRLVKECDKVHGAYIRRGGVCITCGATEALTCSHLFGRARLGTRWDTAADGNCHCQCWACNMAHSDKGQAKYVMWYVETFGEGAFVSLMQRANKPSPMSSVQIAERLEELKAL